MNEQQQAEALARWLAEPAGTAPPEGVDAEVLEAIYAMQPDRAPAPSLTADDILADLGAFGSMDQDGPLPPAILAEEEQPLAARQARLSANRVAGLGALLATAATLLIVARPVLQTDAPMLAAEPAMEEVASAAPVADPYVGGGDLSEADEQELAQAPVDAKQAIAAQLEDGDAVADADLGAVDRAVGGAPSADFAAEQAPRFEGEQLIPEVAAAELATEGDLTEAAELDGLSNTGGAWADDAVAVLDEPEDEDFSGYAMEEAEISRGNAPAATRAAPSVANTADKEVASSFGGRKAKPRQQKKAEAYAPAAAVEQVASEPVAVSRSEAVPSDLSTTSWRASVDATSLARIDDALRIAQAEASAGDVGSAAESLVGLINPPSPAGQYLAGLTAGWYLQDGQLGAAANTAQRGLALGSENTPYRSQLLLIFGDVLNAQGDASGAQAAWSQAAALNAVR